MFAAVYKVLEAGFITTELLPMFLLHGSLLFMEELSTPKYGTTLLLNLQLQMLNSNLSEWDGRDVKIVLQKMLSSDQMISRVQILISMQQTRIIVILCIGH